MEIDIKTVVGSYAQVTLFLLMLSIGLKQGFQGISLLWKQPSLLLRCLLASFLVVPLVAMAIDAILPLSAATRLGLGAMAICPGAPMLYRKLAKGNAHPALAGSFQVTLAGLAILFVPLWIFIFNAVYVADNAVSVAHVAKQVFSVQLIPILLGLCLRQWWSGLADALDEPVEKLGNILLLGVVIIVLIVALPKVAQVGWLDILGVILFVAAAIAAGHLLGKGDRVERISLALTTATRNAGLALALVSLNVKDSGPVLGVIAAIALIAAVGNIIYINLMQKRAPKSDSAGSVTG